MRGVLVPILCIVACMLMLTNQGLAQSDTDADSNTDTKMLLLHWRSGPRIPFPWAPPAIVEKCLSAFHHMPSCAGEIHKLLRDPRTAISDACCKIVVEIDKDCFDSSCFACWLKRHCSNHVHRSPAPAPTIYDDVPAPTPVNDSTPTPAPTTYEDTPSPAPTTTINGDLTPVPTPTIDDDVPAPTPVNDNATPSVAPTPNDDVLAPTPIDDIGPTPASGPTTNDNVPATTPVEDDPTPTPAPTIDDDVLAPTSALAPTPTTNDDLLAPTPTDDDPTQAPATTNYMYTGG